MSVEVRELGEKNNKEKTENKYEETETKQEKQEEVEFELIIDKKSIIFNLSSEMQNKDIDVYVNNELLMVAKASKKSLIKIKKNNNLGKIILDAKNRGEKIQLFA
jgi:predicted PilT family ATPase